MERRTFIKSAGALAVAPTLAARPQAAAVAAKTSRPAAVASRNGLKAVELAFKKMTEREDPLDAAIAGVNLVEADPEEMSVGYGGLPNEDGVVELDASVMHGPTHNAGSVASLRNIMHPSKVAKLVMTRTDHALLVGEGALRFARMHGFREENLLTEAARKVWLAWKETLSERDDRFPPQSMDQLEPKLRERYQRFQKRETGTINCCCVNAAGDIAGVTTTSGLAFKIPGRVGDSPIIGAGLYVDNDYGACGSTGRGEANLLNLSSFLGVEEMRRGLAPKDAGMAVLRRIVEHNVDPRLRDEGGRPNFNVSFYLVNKAGQTAGCALFAGRAGQYAVCDEQGSRHEDLAVLFE